MKSKIILFTLIAISYFASVFSKSVDIIRPGEIWQDNRGVHINAHGGGILHCDGTYYWFGEHKADSTNNAMVGVTCYSSKDLVNWKYCGIALSVSDEKGSEIERGSIIERPKVIYNKKTEKYVMWFHLELKGVGYGAARAGVAISDKPTGPYHFLRSDRVNAFHYPMEMNKNEIAAMDTLHVDKYRDWWTPQWMAAVKKGLFLKRDFTSGQMARDQTVFVDDDGKAYHIYASEENLTLQIAELSSDYTCHTGRYVRVAEGEMNEAPTIFKHNGVYWMITSGCTGWAPNKARMFSAINILGPWKQYDTPCTGNKSDITFGGQGTYILKVEGKDLFIFMADIWCPKHPSDGRYVWLPISFDNKGVPVIKWQDSWNLNI